MTKREKISSCKECIFIATKNIDYIRNTQEINLLKEQYESVDIVAYKDKSYIKRLIKVYKDIVLKSFKERDVFIGFAPQLIVPLFWWKFKKSYVTIDFFISCYDTFVDDRKIIKDNTLLAKVLMRIDQFTLKHADEIIVDTRAHGEYFNKVLKTEKTKMKVLYLEADTQIYSYQKQKKVDDIYRVLYFGSILPLQGIEVILESTQYVSDPEIRFQFIGPIKKELKERYTNSNIEYIEWLTQEELALYIGNADLCLGGHFNSEINKAKNTIAGKTYIYRAMHKPVILGENQANRELFDESMEGIHFVEMGNAQALADKINTIYNSDKNMCMDVQQEVVNEEEMA